MQRAALLLLLVLMATIPVSPLLGQSPFQEDVFPTAAGDLTISFIGHGTLMFILGEKVIHIDPVGREADYTTLPDADLILITHEHGDHLDPAAVAEILKGGTEVVVSGSCEGRLEGARVMRNGDVASVAGFTVEAVPAYNITHMRSEGMPYHPEGDGNGYVITFGDLRVYVAGDTENTPEMKALEGIDIAFLPMNLPYTMTPEMVADAARAFRPRILYPYHFGETDPNELVTLLAGEKGIEVRVREMG
jgi:L-ascorbate metabolism protein UlaG (beta-lactamase superfamily)